MTTSEKPRMFLGMNIVGDINHGRQDKPQRRADELAPYFTAMFEGGVIDGVRWKQYTPYFNDGDPCEFSADGDYPLIRIAGREITDEEANEMAGAANIGDEDDFRAGWIEPDSDDWIEPDSDDEDSPMSTLIGRRIYAKDGRGYRDYQTPPTYEGPHVDLAKAVYAWKAAIGGGEFDHALLELFGDHATITVPARGDIEIETYEHE